MILIVGNTDIHTEKIRHLLEKKGEETLYINPDDFFEKHQFCLNQGNKNTSFVSGINISRIKSVYWYCYERISIPDSIHFHAKYEFKENIENIFGSFLLNLDVLWVNHPETIFLHKFKLNMLKNLEKTGVIIPSTIITNNFEELLYFYESHKRKIIYKPLYGGIPVKIDESNFDSNSIRNFIRIPRQFQEYIEGADIRAHVVGDKTFFSEILSTNENYKIDKDLKISPIKLSLDLESKCIEIAKRFNMLLCGIDFRKTDDEKFVFFEVNPSPQFLIFEEECNYKISESLIELLINRSVG